MTVTGPPAWAGGVAPELAAIARMTTCGQCWQYPGKTCGAGGEHLARYRRAARRGLLSAAGLKAAEAAVPGPADAAALVPELASASPR